MSILISAPIRTGKTLYVIKKIFEELNKGRQVFTNIVGINIDGVISVNSTIDDPYDWRNLPNGCVVVWDEAHEHPAFSEQDLLKNFRIDTTNYDLQKEEINKQETSVTHKKQQIEEVEKRYKRELERRKEEIRDIGRALLLHGHFGIEIYFITQRVTKLNVDVLASVTTHYVMRRKFGLDRAIIWEFGEAITTWSKSTASVALNKTIWAYPKYLYKFYKSSENHQVQKSFPAKYLVFLLLPIGLALYGLNNAKKTGFFGMFPKDELEVQSEVKQEKPIDQKIPIKTVTDPSQVDEELEKLQAESLGLTLGQYRDLKNPEARNQQLAQQQAEYNATQKIEYDHRNPYSAKIDNINYQATSLPKFSGCIKYNGKFTAFTEQGTKINDVDPNVCKRLINDNDRPYNYFQEKNNVVNQNYNSQNNTRSNQQDIQQVQMTREQQAKYYEYLENQNMAQNHTQENLQARTVNGANSL